MPLKRPSPESLQVALERKAMFSPLAATGFYQPGHDVLSISTYLFPFPQIHHRCPGRHSRNLPPSNERQTRGQQQCAAHAEAVGPGPAGTGEEGESA